MTGRRKIAILQPGYIPWLGFFEQLYMCDVFVFLDDVQFTKNDWRNRNRIKTQNGVLWLTVPVLHKSGQKIKDTVIDNKSNWQKKHLQSLRTWYGKSKFFREIIGDIENIYSKKWKYLIDIDMEIILWIKEILNIPSKTIRSSEVNIQNDDRQLRLIEICKKLGCNYFYEGKSGQSYIDVDFFRRDGIEVEFQNYAHPYYNQLWLKEQGFISHLSILDLFFNHGKESLDILTGERTIHLPEGINCRHADELNG